MSEEKEKVKQPQQSPIRSYRISDDQLDTIAESLGELPAKRSRNILNILEMQLMFDRQRVEKAETARIIKAKKDAEADDNTDLEKGQEAPIKPEDVKLKSNKEKK